LEKVVLVAACQFRECFEVLPEGVVAAVPPKAPEKHTIPELLALLTASVTDEERRACATAAEAKKIAKKEKKALPKKVSAAQLYEVDWAKLERDCADMAPTTFKFMVANQHLGDYHDNFDTTTFFKWCCALVITYPEYLQQMQMKKEANALLEAPAYDLWEWGSTQRQHGSTDYPNGRPLVKFIVSMDNAPYHHGIAVQVTQKSKDDLAQILRDHGINEIWVANPAEGVPAEEEDVRTPRSPGVLGVIVEVGQEIVRGLRGMVGGGVNPHAGLKRFLVPGVGEQWPRNNPSAAQVKEGALRALNELKPNLVEPPWKDMFERARVSKNWGPLGGIEVIFSCPFISKQIPIEYIWSDGKNFVALSNQYVADGRTLAHIHSMLLRRWEGKEGDKYSKSCDIYNHCLRVVTSILNVTRRCSSRR